MVANSGLTGRFSARYLGNRLIYIKHMRENAEKVKKNILELRDFSAQILSLIFPFFSILRIFRRKITGQVLPCAISRLLEEHGQTRDTLAGHIRRNARHTPRHLIRQMFNPKFSTRKKLFHPVYSICSRKFWRTGLEYAYNREVRINQENVQDLLPAADQFNIEGKLFHKFS